MKPKFPILMYHAIVSKGESSIDPIYTIDKKAFEQQMKYLFNNGYKSIGFYDLIAFREASKNLPDKSIIITFDDGYLDNYTIAYPILEQYAFKATFFVTVGRIGWPNMMQWQQIRELFNNGMEIGSHTLTHPYPNQLSNECLKYELSESKRRLDEKLMTNIDIFSSPTGYHNKATSRIAKELGYKVVCLNTVGSNDTKSNSLCLRRIAIKRHYSISTFESIVKLAPHTIFYLRIFQSLRNCCRRVLGLGIYEALRKHLLRAYSKT